MMKFGLKEKYITQMHEIFVLYPQVEEVVLYGSRAKGNYRAGSDIDLAMKGCNLDLRILNKINRQIDDLLLPYIVDLSIYNMIENEDLVDHIKRVGVVLYKKE